MRLHQYSVCKMVELDARWYSVHETEAGIEWQPNPNFELTAQYTVADRLFEDAGAVGRREKGRFLRLQAQINY